MKVVSLLDNLSADDRLTAEHGLSLYIETERRRILFDTGQTDAFARNAGHLGVDLRLVDMAVVSHGHYDHTGGLAKFLALNDHAPVYVHRRAFERHLVADGREIGMDPSPAGNPRIVPTDDVLPLDDDMWLCSCNDEARPFPSYSQDLLMVRNGHPEPDDFTHEQYLCLRERGRLVVISGCSHKGILNIVQWLRPDVLVGGFHFKSLKPDQQGRATLDFAARHLAAFPTEYYTCHCTGRGPFEYLKQTLGDRLHYLACGSRISLP